MTTSETISDTLLGVKKVNSLSLLEQCNKTKQYVNKSSLQGDVDSTILNRQEWWNLFKCGK